MILISDTTHTKYSSDTVEVWTYNMSLKFKIEKSKVVEYPTYYEIISMSTGEHIATFPKSETAFMQKTPETTKQITQN